MRRRVLLLSPGLPLPTWGAGTRIYQLARHLSTDHEVTVLTYADEAEAAAVAPLRDFCRDVRLVPTRSGGPLTRRARQLRWSVSPSRHSIAINGLPSSSPTSYIVHILG